MDSSSSSPNAAILQAKFHLRGGFENEFAAWQAEVLTRAAGFTGFLNSEITPSGDASSWAVMLRFANTGQLDAWRESETWRHLLGEVQSLLAEKSSIEIEVRETEPDGGVIEVIVTKVKAGKEVAYREWETKIQQAQSKFPGYLGSYVQPPLAGELGWTTLMRFDTAEHLDKWLKSPERAALLGEVEPLIDYAHLQRMETSFPGWFPTDPNTGQGPPFSNCDARKLLSQSPPCEPEFFTGLVHWQYHQRRIDDLADDAGIHQGAWLVALPEAGCAAKRSLERHTPNLCPLRVIGCNLLEICLRCEQPRVRLFSFFEKTKKHPFRRQTPQVTTNYEHPKIRTIKNFCAEPSRCRGAHCSSEKDDS